jgi:hypothetical protein
MPLTISSELDGQSGATDSDINNRVKAQVSPSNVFLLFALTGGQEAFILYKISTANLLLILLKLAIAL